MLGKRGKTLSAIVVILVLAVLIMVPFVLSIDSGNIKIYDKDTKSVIVKDKSNIELASIKLNTPLDYHVPRGYQKVAEFTINNKEYYANALEKLDFYNVRDNMNKINRNFDYKYKTYEEIEVEDYQNVCKEIWNVTNKNNTQICESVKIGSHSEQKEIWKDLDKNLFSKDEEITIGIFTNVEKGDRIEWIPTFYGVKIDEWAGWTEDLSVNLAHYYKFDNNDLTDALGFYNGTNTGTTNIDGIINQGRYLDGGDMINFSSSAFGTSVAFSFWFMTNSTGCFGDGCIIYYHGNDGTQISEYIAIQRDEIWYTFGAVDGSNNIFKTTSANLQSNTWYHIIINGTGDAATADYSIWVNGVNQNITLSTNGENRERPTGGDYSFWIATWQTFYSKLQGRVDEFAKWNRTLTANEVLYLYNDGEGITYGPTDENPPQIIILIMNSSDLSNKSNQNLNCYATLTDNEQENLTASWTWYKNDVGYLSGNKTVQNNTNTLIATLGSGNITKGQNWTCEVKPFDGTNWGDASNSTSMTILNSAPTQNNPLLKTSSEKNLSTEDLICYNQSTFDADNDAVVNIYNWYKNSQSLLALNMPFETNANDYSGNNNDGIKYGNLLDVQGKVGRALQFDGIDDYVNTKDINEAEGINSLTIEAWIKPKARATGVVNPMIISKYYAWNLYINNNNNGFVFAFNDGGGWSTDSISYSTQLTTNVWYHVVGRYNGLTCKIFVNGNEVASSVCNGNINTNANAVKIGQWNNNEWFNGTIDEIKIYPYALTPEQIQAHYNLEYNKIVSQQTSGGDNYMCQVTPNDGEEDGTTLNSSELNVLWGITFNVTSGEDDSQLNNFNINCNNSFSASGVSSPYIIGFLPGSYSCTFSQTQGFYYNKTITFTANNDTTINVILSVKFDLTVEEHTWLEAIYNCLYSGDCSLYNLLLEVNQTVGKIWENTAPTNEGIITFENITNKVVDSTHNLTIDYSVNIPIKAGYSLGTYLPVRMGYWFLNEANTSCYNQGDKPTGVEDPYCQPLIIETLGPMGGSVNFTVKLHPSLPAGNYSIKRIIDIDPNNVWINYGQENIGSVIMAEGLTDYEVAVEKTGEIIPEKQGLLQNIKSGITGAVTGMSNLHLSGWQIVIVIAIVGLILLTSIISRTIIKLKKK